MKQSIYTVIFILILLSACAVAPQPALTMLPKDQVSLPPEPDISLAPPTSVATAAWSIYHKNPYGFSFEYPSVYDEPCYNDSCGLKENLDGIHLGHQIDISILESNDLNLAEYASNLLQSKGWTSESLKKVIINGSAAVTVEYRFGGTNRFGTFTLIGQNSHVFALTFSAGSFCDILEANITEPEVYSHILETLQFNP
jgi:hypothetical protein